MLQVENKDRILYGSKMIKIEYRARRIQLRAIKNIARPKKYFVARPFFLAKIPKTPQFSTRAYIRTGEKTSSPVLRNKILSSVHFSPKSFQKKHENLPDPCLWWWFSVLWLAGRWIVFSLSESLFLGGVLLGPAFGSRMSCLGAATGGGFLIAPPSNAPLVFTAPSPLRFGAIGGGLRFVGIKFCWEWDLGIGGGADSSFCFCCLYTG